mmetsp:Transcript_21849/g.28257  ORF Transcript_21849/g.28257 Transcript_21849/m.28257 type:complete len:118 (-) Transcript_21849:371-724(-)|eukprot:CAMPEP_0198137826 /NCGR_PEP_ID=MMETSP1443-20131203/1290_1 /TAXON_ID=186043 /ORGANISM="Entomoneis sp., Strain CCMP2396" /LENGTH=117 /DNA_ID=CAMNT_0043799385 /DNA_START=277 /DNA_END=630 /DNA_ORIENTATION=-
MARNFLLILLCLFSSASAFVSVTPRSNAALITSAPASSSTTAAFVFGKKPKAEEDFSDIETRDMTREEMLQYNKATEDVMNGELIGMTIFSLVISVPMLYLVWVGFFSETAEMNLDL